LITGIGGFSVKIPKPRGVAGKSVEKAKTEETASDSTRKWQRKRKAKSELLEFLPAPMQEAFFGRKTLDCVGAGQSAAVDLEESLDDSPASKTDSLSKVIIIIIV
jgi:hypothetical protein